MHGTGFSAKDRPLFLSTVLSGKAGVNVTGSVISKLPGIFGDMLTGL
jgi:hypothetical protein